MQNKDEGWVSIHRRIRKHPLWTQGRFSMGQAWVDLILRANYCEREIMYNSELIIVKPGHFLTSKVKLAEEWHWDRKTVTRFLKMLEKNDMIHITSDNCGTWIYIVNYEYYQRLTDNTRDNDKDKHWDKLYPTNNKINKSNNKKSNSFCDFEQRELDFKALEKKLLSRDGGGD